MNEQVRIPITMRFLRFCMIVLGLGFVATEMTFSTLGSLKSNADVYAYGMVAAGIIVIAAEAFMAHRSAELRAEKNELWIGGACLWVGLFIFAMYFTATGANVRTEAATATRVAGWTKRDSVEQTTAELTEKRRILSDTVKSMALATLSDGATSWKLRPLGSVENDGRYKASKNCSDARNAGQRAVCQEHSMASTLASKETELKETEAKLEASRNRLDNTAVVLNKNAHDASLLVGLGMSPDGARFAVSLFFGALLNLASSLIWFYIPSRADLFRKHRDGAKPMDVTAPGAPHAVHVHVGQQTQAPASDAGGIVSSLNPVTGRIEFQNVIPVSKTN